MDSTQQQCNVVSLTGVYIGTTAAHGHWALRYGSAATQLYRQARKTVHSSRMQEYDVIFVLFIQILIKSLHKFPLFGFLVNKNWLIFNNLC